MEEMPQHKILTPTTDGLCLGGTGGALSDCEGCLGGTLCEPCIRPV
jgi:hypothetical protein